MERLPLQGHNVFGQGASAGDRLVTLRRSCARPHVALLWAVALSALFLQGCAAARPSAPDKLTVAAASNLKGLLDQVGAAFRETTGIVLVLSGASAAASVASVRVLHGGRLLPL